LQKFRANLRLIGGEPEDTAGIDMRFTMNPQQNLGNSFAQLGYALGAMPALKQQWEQQAQEQRMKQEMLAAQMQGQQAQTALNQAKLESERSKQQAVQPLSILKNALAVQGVPISELDGVASFATTGQRPLAYQEPVDGVGPMPENTKYYTDPSLLQSAGKLAGLSGMALANGGNIEQITQAQGNLQKQAALARALEMTQAGNNMGAGGISAVLAGKEFTPFKQVGNTGTAFNPVTGEQFVSNSVLASLFNDIQKSQAAKQIAQASQARAAAGASGALAGLRGVLTRNAQIQGGIDALDFDAAREGKPLPSTNRASRGADSTNAATDNKIFQQMMKEPQWATAPDAEFTAELNRRSALTPSRQPQAPKAEAAPAVKYTPMPKEKSALKKGEIYDTPRGAARWNGSAFEKL
jgi:hypothetical protein